MGSLLSSLRELFLSSTSEICVVGLSNSGKTTFVHQLEGKTVETVPTIGVDIKVMKAGNTTLKLWDLTGQDSHRSEWIRYAQGCSVLVFVVDTTAPDQLPEARRALHQLLEDRQLSKIPLLVLANKIDLGPQFTERELIKSMNLDLITEQHWLVGFHGFCIRF